MYNPNMDYTFIKGGNMYFKTFNKLNNKDKIEILLQLNLMYDLSTSKGLNSLKKEFKHIEPQIKEVMIEKGLYKEK